MVIDLTLLCHTGRMKENNMEFQGSVDPKTVNSLSADRVPAKAKGTAAYEYSQLIRGNDEKEES